MLDDGTNIHGIYTKVTKKMGPNKLEVGFGHFQQYGVNLYKPGDVITVNHGHTVKMVGRYRISTSELVSPERIVLTIEGGLDGISVGDFVENADRMPAVEIRRCRTGRNRPRGFLITTPRPVIIEECTFNNCCCAIHFTGDTKFWYESGPVSDVLIRNNTFLDCGYQGGDYTIVATPEYEKSAEAPYYHRNIRITDNRFETFTDGLLYAQGVDGIVFEKNSYQCSGHYPKRIESDPVTLVDCRNTAVEIPAVQAAGKSAK